MCNDTFSKILAFIGALVLGAVVAVLYFFGIIVALPVIVYIGLGVAIGLLVFLLVLLYTEERGSRCLCRYASPLLYACVLAVVAAVLVLAVGTARVVLATVLAGAWATLLFFAVILFLMMVSCHISARCGCGAPKDCRCGEPRCSNGSCRFG